MGKGLTGGEQRDPPSASSLQTRRGPAAGGLSSPVDPPVRGSEEPRSGREHAWGRVCWLEAPSLGRWGLGFSADAIFWV